MEKLAPSAQRRLDSIAEFFAGEEQRKGRLRYWYREKLAYYLSYYISSNAKILEIGCGGGELLSLLKHQNPSGVDICEKQIERARKRIPNGTFDVMAGEYLHLDEKYDVILISDTLNYAGDVQAILSRAKGVSHSKTRLILTYFNFIWQPGLILGELLRLKSRQPECNWLSTQDMANLLDLAGWELIVTQPRILLPLPMGVFERIVNRWIAPVLGPLNLAITQIARPRMGPEPKDLPSVSIVVPARNEAGNLSEILLRTPEMGCFTEFIFVEGGSTDNTWEVMKEIQASFPEKRIKIMRQSGRGKGNAVREGFNAADGEILMILDADLTTPPEDLPKFFNALVSNQAEFANGVRLVYPMEKRAMRFFNLCANKFFAIAFSWVLGQSVKDTLCGTKVLWKSDYEKITKNRLYFGNFDPFGDFDLLFGAHKLGLKIADIPVRYAERTYGETNIHRWRHGMILLRMLCFAIRRIKFL